MDMVIIPSRCYDTAPVTTSQIIAELINLSHATVLRHIRQEGGCQFAKYRLTCSEMCKLEDQPYEYLTEPQAMQIFQQIRKTDAIKDAEAELAGQFYEAKRILNERRQQRSKCIIARNECIELERRNGMSNADDNKCLDLVHRMAFDKKKQEYRNSCGIFGSGKRTIDYMSVDDLYKLTVAQEEIAELLRTGNNTYEQIESIVIPQPEPVMQQPAVYSEASEKAVGDKMLEERLAKMLRSLCA